MGGGGGGGGHGAQTMRKSDEVEAMLPSACSRLGVEAVLSVGLAATD